MIGRRREGKKDTKAIVFLQRLLGMTAIGKYTIKTATSLRTSKIGSILK